MAQVQDQMPADPKVIREVERRREEQQRREEQLRRQESERQRRENNT